MSQRKLVATLVACSLALGFGLTEARAQLDDISKALTLKGQKIVREVNLNLSTARALERQNNFQKAREILRQTKLLLEDDADLVLPERTRLDLLRQVNTRLADVAAQLGAQKKADEAAAQDREDRLSQAGKKPSGTTTTNPGTGVSGAARDRIGSTKDILSSVNQLRGMREAGTGLLNSIEVSATPIEGIVEYPKYWKQITDMRGPKMDPKEVALLKALNSTLSVDFKGTSFGDVIEHLQERTGQPIIMDENSLKDAMVDTSDPVNFKINKVTVRTILRKVLADKGLAYIIRDGAIQVMSAQKAKEITVVRAYPVRDLVGADPMIFGQATPFVIMQNVQGLINVIQSSIEPGYWQPNGPGTITFHPQSMSLVVRASAEMHYMFGGGFGR